MRYQCSARNLSALANFHVFTQINFVPLSWAVHKLDGIVTPANAQFSSSELQYQLKDSGAKCLFTCCALLKTALHAAKGAGLSEDRVYLLDEPAAEQETGGAKTTSHLVERGKESPPVALLTWQKSDGKKRVAYICYSSGTSGLPVRVRI